MGESEVSNYLYPLQDSDTACLPISDKPVEADGADERKGECPPADAAAAAAAGGARRRAAADPAKAAAAKEKRASAWALKA